MKERKPKDGEQDAVKQRNHSQKGTRKTMWGEKHLKRQRKQPKPYVWRQADKREKDTVIQEKGLKARKGDVAAKGRPKLCWGRGQTSYRGLAAIWRTETSI